MTEADPICRRVARCQGIDTDALILGDPSPMPGWSGASCAGAMTGWGEGEWSPVHVDVDVHSHPGNGACITGVSIDPRGGRRLNLDKQRQNLGVDGSPSVAGADDVAPCAYSAAITPAP